MESKSLFLTALCLAAFVLPVRADSDMKDINVNEARQPVAGPYVSLQGGLTFLQENGDQRTTLGDPTTVGAFGPFGTSNTSSNNTSHVGGVGGLKLGYKFQPCPIIATGFALQPAVEFDGYFLQNKLGQSGTFTQPAVPIIGGPVPANVAVSSNGRSTNGAFLINAVLRVKTPCGVTPYVGLGVGGEYLDTTRSFSSTLEFPGIANFPVNNSVSRSDQCLSFAAQAIAGVDYELNKHWSLFAEYKFLAAIEPSFTYNGIYGGNLPNALGGAGLATTGLNGETYHYHPDFIGQQMFVIGITYNF